MKLTLALIQVVLLALVSTNTSSMCPTERNLHDDCANPSEYFENYAAMDCSQWKIVDGLEAQWTFIRNRDIGVSTTIAHRHFLTKTLSHFYLQTTVYQPNKIS